MKVKKLSKQVNCDIDKAIIDLATLRDDSIKGLNRIFEQLTDTTQKTVDMTAKTVNETVGQGLSQFNTKIQEAVNRVPGGIGKKATGYPWITVTISFTLGILLGILLKPGRQPMTKIQI